MMKNNLAVYDRINEQIEVITVLGKAITHSGMFGCTKEEQGLVLALQCITERKPPLEMCKTYHIIKGRLSKRADAMLADFRRTGGKFKFGDLKNVSVQSAVVEFENETYNVEYSLDQARKAGLIRKDSGWVKFPAAMLRARLVSETLRAIAPELVQGTYTPEEISDFGEEDPLPNSSPVKNVTPPVEDKDEVPMDYSEPATFEQVQKLETYWRALKNPPVTGFGSLTSAQAGKLIHELQSEMNELAKTQSTAMPESGFEPPPPPTNFSKAIGDWLADHEDRVNSYLIEIKWLKAGQTWRDLPVNNAAIIQSKTESFALNCGIPVLEGPAA